VNRFDSDLNYGSQTFNTYDIILSVIDYKVAQHQLLSQEIYHWFKSLGYKVLLDDRDVRAGKKMADSELIACMYRVIISKQAIQNEQIEILNRKTMQKQFISLKDYKSWKI
jgi:prolyl-tRNA synthetase